MSKSGRIAFVVAATTLATISYGCGSAQDGATGTSYEALCAGEPPLRSDGTSTMASCPFVQQADNIVTFGEAQNGRALYDGAGAFVANVESTCDKWAVATDAQGVTVIVQRERGQVVSHGTVHVGQPVSTLPTQLTLPLQMK